MTMKVVDCEPLGSGVLVELLTDQEVLGTTIIVADSKKKIGPQGYILKLGPWVNTEREYQFKVGDRVLISGSGTPVPDFRTDKGRDLVILEPHAIKGILREKEVDSLADKFRPTVIKP